MPDSIPGRFKEAIEQAVPELTGRVWRRDHLPDGQALPYVTIFDGIADTPVLHGDASGIGWFRLTQVDVWQELLLATDALTAQVMNALDGLSGPSAYGWMTTIVESTTKVPDEEPGIDHVAITCRTPHPRIEAVALQQAEQPELRRLVVVRSEPL